MYPFFLFQPCAMGDNSYVSNSYAKKFSSWFFYSNYPKMESSM